MPNHLKNSISYLLQMSCLRIDHHKCWNSHVHKTIQRALFFFGLSVSISDNKLKCGYFTAKIVHIKNYP